MGVLQILASDQSTVLWDFADPTGAANPSTVATKLAAGIDMGTVEQELTVFRPGSFLTNTERPPVEMTIPMMASAATDDALWAGLGQLGRYLAAASVTNPVYLKWTELTEVRYIDVIGALNLPQLLRGQSLGAIAALRKSSLGPIPLRLLRQPWMRGPEETVTGVTVPNDPATGTKVRTYPLTVKGDLPTQGKVKVTMDTGSAVERILIASRARGTRPSSYFADYLSDTGFLQAESTNRGWTIALGTNTSSVADANASGGNVARVTHATNPTVYARRITATRTTKLDSLRGSWDVWVRVKAAGAKDYRLQLRWGPSTADPPALVLDEVQHDTSVNGTPGTFGYVELNLGRIYIPETVALGGLRLELWTRHTSAVSANLDADLFWLSPVSSQGTVVVPGGGASDTPGADLTTPVSNPASGTAGTATGTYLSLDTTTDNAGVGPNTGTVFGAGRYRVSWKAGSSSGGIVRAVIRNITSSTDAFSQIFGAVIGWNKTLVAEFDANGTSAYQVQVDDPTTTAVEIDGITIEAIPSLGLDESIRTDPTRPAVDRLDSSGNLSGYLACEGAVPLALEPGDMHIMVRADEIALALYEENENKLARTPTVSVTYPPRYAL
jgi:hypothetical protein